VGDLPMGDSDEDNDWKTVKLNNFIDEEYMKDLIQETLSQNTPKKVILEAVSLVKKVIFAKDFIKNSEVIISRFKQVMIETFIHGKDHEVRVTFCKIIKMFLSEWRGYFRKFSEIFKSTDCEDIRKSVLNLLIEYSITVDKSVTATVFELICMLIRSLNHEERDFATS